MSLINQLLQDLDKRHASGAEVKSLSPRVRPLPGPIRWRTYVLLGLGLVATAAAAAVMLSYPARPKLVRHDLPPPVASNPAATSEAHTTPSPPAADTQATAVPTPPAVTALAVPVFQLAEELSRLPEAKPKATAAPPRKVAVQRETRSVQKPRATPAGRKANGTVTASPPAPVAQEAAPDKIEEVTLAQPANVLPVEKQMRAPTAYERAEIEFRNAVARLRQGRVSDAETGFRRALEQDHSHGAARQALISLLIDLKRFDDTEEVLRETLEVNPRQPKHAMLLARLELERGDVSGAVKTLESVKPYAGLDAEYLAFLAAAYQREARHPEALDMYRSALGVAPGNAVWMIGAGISLQALKQPEQAREAYRAAAESRTLTPELQAFVDLRLRELTPAKR